jgi:hypothetical protein
MKTLDASKLSDQCSHMANIREIRMDELNKKITALGRWPEILVFKVMQRECTSLQKICTLTKRPVSLLKPIINRNPFIYKISDQREITTHSTSNGKTSNKILYYRKKWIKIYT